MSRFNGGNSETHSTHGGMAWDYDKEGNPYPKSVPACEAEDIQRAWNRFNAREDPK